VETADQTMRFDAIVLASPLDGALRFLDASPEEKALFEKIRYVDYRVILADAQGLPNTRYTFATQHLTRPGEVMFWYKRWKAANTYTFYAIGDVPGSTSGITGAADAMLRRLDGKLGTVHREERWRYFPHVTPEDMRAGFYRRLEAMQGTRRTYYAGEVMSFPTVETVVAYSRALVDRHFAASAVANLHAR
jgi:predicted NAD/FAD-binding protein